MTSCETEWWTVCQFLKSNVWIMLSTTRYARHIQQSILCTFPYNIYTKSPKCWLDNAQTLFIIKINPRERYWGNGKFSGREKKANSHLANLSGQSSKYYFWKVVSLPEAHTEWLNSDFSCLLYFFLVQLFCAMVQLS